MRGRETTFLGAVLSPSKPRRMHPTRTAIAQLPGLRWLEATESDSEEGTRDHISGSCAIAVRANADAPDANGDSTGPRVAVARGDGIR